MRPSASTIEPAYGSRTWPAIRSNGRRAWSSGSRQVWWTYSAAPWSISHGRPCQTSRFGFWAVRSGLVTRASNQTTSAAKAGSTSGAPGVAAAGLKARAPGRKSIPRLSPPLLPDEVVDLLVRLGVAEGGIDLDAHQVGHGQADRPAELAGEPFGDQRARALAGATELDDVQPVVVRLDEAGQRPTLAQGRHVAGGDDGAHHDAEPSRARCRRGSACRDEAAGRMWRHDCCAFLTGSGRYDWYGEGTRSRWSQQRPR